MFKYCQILSNNIGNCQICHILLKNSPQVAQLMLLCVLGFWPWPYIKMIFPLLLASFLPIRTIILPKIIESKYLQVGFLLFSGSYIWLLSGAGRGASLTSAGSFGSQQSAGLNVLFHQSNRLSIQWKRQKGPKIIKICHEIEIKGP